MLIPKNYYTEKTVGDNIKKCMFCGCNFEIPDDDKNSYEIDLDNGSAYVCEECEDQLNKLTAMQAAVDIASDPAKDTTMVVSQALG